MNQKKAPPQIAMCDCKSSQVGAHGYDAATKTLAVRFNNGGTYHYHDVEPDVYERLKKADSVGSFLHKHVKPTFKFSKI